MKKLFLFAILAVAGIATASAEHYRHVVVACNGEIVFEKDALIGPEDESDEAFNEYENDLYEIFCDGEN